MDALTVIMILVFGIAAVVPIIWSIVCLVRGDQRFWFPIIGTGFAIVTLLVLFIGMATDWFGCCRENANGVTCIVDATGEVSETCPNPNPWGEVCSDESCAVTSICTDAPTGQYCPVGESPVFTFCEAFSDGAVKQPWSTWSDISFIASGLWVLWWLAMYGRGSNPANPMRTLGVLSLTYGLIVIFMGPGSMYYHASMKNWGGYLDSLSVVIWLAFNAAYVWHALIFSLWGNLRGVGRTIFVTAVAGALLLLFAILGWVDPGARLYGYLVCGGLWGLGELIYWICVASCDVRYKRTFWVFAINLSLLVITMTIWVFFNPDITLTTSPEACQHREGFPGHALFHITAAFATAATFFSFATEKRDNEL